MVKTKLAQLEKSVKELLLIDITLSKEGSLSCNAKKLVIADNCQ